MKNNLAAIFGVIFGVSAIVAIAGGILVGFGLAGKWILTQVFSMKPEVLQIWLPTAVTLFGGAAGILVTKRMERKREEELRQQELRARLYEPAFQTLFDLIALAQEEGVAAVPGAFRGRLTEVGRLLLSGASDGVICSFASLQGFDFETGSLEELARQVAALIVLMRADLSKQGSLVGKSVVLQVLNMPGLPEGEDLKPTTGIKIRLGA